MDGVDWAGLGPLLIMIGIPVAFGGLAVTDRLGWTRVFVRKSSDRSALGSAMLGAEYLFAPEARRQAIEYRQDKKSSVQRRASGDDVTPD